MGTLIHQVRLLNDDIREVPEFFKQKKLPSLDGFRAVSILIVVGEHMGFRGNAFLRIIFNGSLGVNIFFVISGFLITSLLLKEKAVSGTISLKDFYVRRILRIFPVAYLYLLVIVVLNYIFHLHISAIYIAAAFLYITNFTYFIQYKSTIIGHYWSLAVEEQFYIIFPFILKKNFRVFLYFILIIIFILPVLIHLEFALPQIANRPMFYFTHFFIKFQSIAVGCLFSILLFKKLLHVEVIKKGRLLYKLICVAAIFLLHHTAEVNEYSVYSNLLISTFTALLIVLNLFFIEDWMYKFLNHPWVVKIGILSYSIYIWHMVYTTPQIFPPWIANVPAALVLTLITAFLSYNYWEKPFLNLKKRFAGSTPKNIRMPENKNAE